jgi:hypothetical protein
MPSPAKISSLAFLLCVVIARGGDQVPAFAVAEKGRALTSIVISVEAGEETKLLARDLADGLHQITGGDFEIKTGDASLGVFVGTADEWPDILPPVAAGESPNFAREDYVLKSEESQLWIVGRTGIGLQNAVWDFLHRLGFRQYYPGKNWEIWPHSPDLTVSLDAFETPDFYHRILRPNRDWPENQEVFEQWAVRNRMVSGFKLSSGHSYQAIIARNPEFFEAHPETLAVSKASKSHVKFDPSHPALLQLVAEDSLRQLEKNPTADSISMEPSDLGGWRQDSPLGSPSNQALTLANYVARAIRERFPDVKIGMHAYSEHSLPPDIEVDPGVVITAATSFISGGKTIDEILEGWKAKGAALGIREYLSILKEFPGQSRSTDLTYLTTSIPNFHNAGARFWQSEGSNGFGTHGLGYYVASRLLWNTEEAARRDAIKQDFLQRSFGPAAPEMQPYFDRCLLAEGRPMMSSDLIGRMYRHLDKALKKSDSPAITARLLDYVIYTRCIELWFAWESTKSSEKMAAYEALYRFAYRTRHSHMVNSMWHLTREIPTRQRFKLAPEWKSDEPVTDDELHLILREGIAANAVNGIEPVGFSLNLVPLAPTGGAPPHQAPPPILVRGPTPLYYYADKAGADFEVTVNGANTYRNRGPVRIRMFSDQNPDAGEPVATAEAPADKADHTLKMRSAYAGLHRVELSDSGGGTNLSWPPGQRVVFVASAEENFRLVSTSNFVIFVPQGTASIGGYAESLAGILRQPDGRTAFTFQQMDKPGYFSVPTPPDKTGTCWQLSGMRGKKTLLTVPPYMARSPAELLVPAEVLPQGP